MIYERSEVEGASNHYNCPIVTSYSENIKNNVEEITGGKIRLRNPFMSYSSLQTVTQALVDEFDEIPADEITRAARIAWAEQDHAREDVTASGDKALRYMAENNVHGIVLAGRPYHLDPEINHGIPELISSYGFAVLTEDSVSHLGHPDRPLIVSDQWMYHSRLYAAASYVATRSNLDLVQLNSFGCGLDAVTTDQVNDILSAYGKIYTCLKIDEINNLGAARIRIRSLISAINERKKTGNIRHEGNAAHNRVIFTEDMRKNYTILVPQLSPIHMDLLGPAFAACGYNIEVMDNDNRAAIDAGLKYVNNDACYPSLCVVGQFMNALESGKYDLDRTALLMTQTGGGCRATNYVGFIRRALEKAGMQQVPVISLNLGSIEVNPGFHINIEMLIKAAFACVFGDIMMRCVYRMRPYELEKGSVDAVHNKWLKICQDFLSSKKKPNFFKFHSMCKKMIEEFDNIPIDEKLVKPRVGIVGEILVKYSPSGNNHLVELLEQEGAEAVSPDLLDFMLYCFYCEVYKANELGTSKKARKWCNLGIWAVEHPLRGVCTKAFAKSKHFSPQTPIKKIAELAEPIVSIGNQTGEGWFLTGEMIELIHDGVPNIVCCQPFACLPNHVVGKGVIKAIRHAHPGSNIVAIDYDPGASEVNQLNRIKLMLEAAKRKIKEQE